MNPFFENLEDSSAFSFYFNEDGKAVQVKDTQYILYEGDIFPMTVFADELRALNDYCYTIVTASEKQLEEIKKSFQHYIKEEPEPSFCYTEFMPYEKQMALEMEENQWQWISDVTAGHLVILLYSFLEKTLKYIFRWFMEDEVITLKYPVKRPKVYSWLYNILEMNEEMFQEKYKEVYDVLEKCRKIRNHFAHDNLEGVEEPEIDYIYERRQLKESFRLVDFITVISIILYEVEEVYERKER